jgi:aerobic-type carbon monoxide dehydrogenase small subunit (CoxS/CutS family)
MADAHLSIRVNGERHELDVDTRTSLARNLIVRTLLDLTERR